MEQAMENLDFKSSPIVKPVLYFSWELYISTPFH